MKLYVTDKTHESMKIIRVESISSISLGLLDASMNDFIADMKIQNVISTSITVASYHGEHRFIGQICYELPIQLK